MFVVFWHTDCSGWPIVFLVVQLGFFCFGPANVECFMLSLPEHSLNCEYCTVVLYAVPPWQTEAGSKNHVRLCVLRMLRLA